MGVNVRQWYMELPRAVEKATTHRGASSVMRIDAYYTSQHCVLCGVLNLHPRGLNSGDWLCRDCKASAGVSYFLLQNETSSLERQLSAVRRVCLQCLGGTTFAATWHDRTRMVCHTDDCDVWSVWLRALTLYEKCGAYPALVEKQ